MIVEDIQSDEQVPAEYAMDPKEYADFEREYAQWCLEVEQNSAKKVNWPTKFIKWLTT